MSLKETRTQKLTNAALVTLKQAAGYSQHTIDSNE